ncbi:MarR family winged helix-turn-helix transcriptional regulator [Arenibaculum pallidiluteum]|uniref:MarR family winged helix-turn-helix transcriptional regulator n=1 Tax=Arenibaculum pallidiluteum TaxID=2812559 RepID=UPI001A96F69B|nr:MarR family winged helix-turn-helix transcriptional regulator [Arenibaculum pallidiluteum]
METIELERFLPYRLNRIAAAVSRRFRGVYAAQTGLSVPEWRVLATLAQLGTLTAKAIGEHSDMHKTKVSRAVAELERRRWLRRRPNPGDRREELLTLSAAGLHAYAAIVPGMLALERELTGSLGPQGIEALLTALDGLERVMGLDRPAPPVE